VRRNRFTRFAAPAAFLAAVTIGVLVVRAGFEHGKHPARSPTTTTRAHKTKRKVPNRHHRRTYTVQSGDTYASIASRLGTTVVRLEQLNPGIDPTALRVGETIRVQ
jgi:LysM repeat protein